MVSPNNSLRESELGGQAARESPEGWPGEARTGTAAPEGEAPSITVLGQRRCSDTTTPPQSHMSCLDPPCPLSVPSHYSQEQEHPPSTLQN